MKTGDVEVIVDSLSFINKAGNLPFHITPGAPQAVEVSRLKHRYLDLRCDEMQFNLRFRSNAAMVIRHVLTKKFGFVEVETPTLFKQTPKGSREFMVPSRQAGKFYSLAQSPQQFKQMLMVGGMDRYFQFARCYRDEDLRSDRQPEFTQLDLEMSFVEQCGIQSLVEELLAHLWKEVLPDITLSYPFQRVTYNHAIDKYGSDKPDTSFGWTLNDVTREARNDIACVEVICSFVVPSGSKFISDSLIKKEVTRIMKEWKLNIEETNSETVVCTAKGSM
jgi:aspartyl-tRNA synthetase